MQGQVNDHRWLLLGPTVALSLSVYLLYDRIKKRKHYGTALVMAVVAATWFVGWYMATRRPDTPDALLAERDAAKLGGAVGAAVSGVGDAAGSVMRAVGRVGDVASQFIGSALDGTAEALRAVSSALTDRGEQTQAGSGMVSVVMDRDGGILVSQTLPDPAAEGGVRRVETPVEMRYLIAALDSILPRPQNVFLNIQSAPPDLAAMISDAISGAGYRLLLMSDQQQSAFTLGA